MSTRTPEEWGEEYESNFTTYSRYCVKLEGLLHELIELEKLDVIQIEARPKAPDRFVAKQRRKQYTDPFTDMTDLVGLRVIVYYVDDLDRVGDLITEHFEQDPGNSHVNRLTQDPDRFGYDSDHYVVGLSDGRAGLPDWATYSEIKFEIQVRTALQHAWGAISRKLAYEAEEEVPRELRRQLFRLSALLELADKEFADFRSSTEQVFVRHRDEVQEGDLDAAIDASSLEAYLAVHLQEDNWTKRAIAVGFTDQEDAFAVSDDFRARELSAILRTLEREGVSRLGQLHELFEDAEVWGDDVLRELIEKSTAEWLLLAIPIDIVHLLILVGTEADEETVEQTSYADPLKRALTDIIAARRE